MQHFDVDGRKIQVVYNGVEDVFRQRLPPEELAALAARPRHPPALPALRRQSGQAAQEPRHGRAGLRPGPADGAVRRAAGLRRRAARASEFKIRQRAEYLGIGDKVRLLGHVAHEALPAIYQGATPVPLPHALRGLRPAGDRGDGLGRGGDHLEHLGAQGDRARATRSWSTRSTSTAWRRRSPT